MKRAFKAAFISALLILAIARLGIVDLAKANPFYSPPVYTIYIRSDGSLDQSELHIQKTGNVYSFVSDMTLFSEEHCHSIVVQCSNVILDGAGYILEAYGTYQGIVVIGSDNVTIQNVVVKHFVTGIKLLNSSNITVQRNRVECPTGVSLQNSLNNTVTENTLTRDYTQSILLSNSSNNIISKNLIDMDPYGAAAEINNGDDFLKMAQMHGLHIYNSSNNIIAENSITSFKLGIQFRSSSNNTLYRNNFINTKQIDDLSTALSVNNWNFSGEGNYWNDYVGVDNDKNGIGDTPYAAYANNTDWYPLMKPFETQHSPSPSPPSSTSSSSSSSSTSSPSPTSSTPQSDSSISPDATSHPDSNPPPSQQQPAETSTPANAIGAVTIAVAVAASAIVITIVAFITGLLVKSKKRKH